MGKIKTKKKILALIPARGGSKSIRKKNLIKINNKSLIELSFEVAKNSKYVSKIICSTEDKKIINHCKRIGLETILRPKKYAKDDSDIFFTAKHVLDTLKNENFYYDIIVLIQPTSPFLKKKQFEALLKNFIKEYKKYSSFQTVHETPHNYHFLNSRIINDKIIKFKFFKERKNKTNKQKKIKTFSFGNLVACKTSSLMKTKNFFSHPSKPIMIDRVSSFDLDNREDLLIMKKFYEKN